MAKITPEKRVQIQIIDYLDSLKEEGLPLEWFRRDAIGPNYKKGLPDIWVITNGRHIEIEVKAPGCINERSAKQIEWEKRFNACRIPYMVVDSLERFKELFSLYKRETLPKQ